MLKIKQNELRACILLVSSTPKGMQSAEMQVWLLKQFRMEIIGYQDSNT